MDSYVLLPICREPPLLLLVPFRLSPTIGITIYLWYKGIGKLMKNHLKSMGLLQLVAMSRNHNYDPFMKQYLSDKEIDDIVEERCKEFLETQKTNRR